MEDQSTKDDTIVSNITNNDSINSTAVDDAEKTITPIVVDWDSPNDQQNPMNWSKNKKWSTIALVAYITFVT